MHKTYNLLKTSKEKANNLVGKKKIYRLRTVISQNWIHKRMASELLTHYITLVVTKKMQIKITTKYNFMSIRLAILKHLTEPSDDKNMKLHK